MHLSVAKPPCVWVQALLRPAWLVPLLFRLVLGWQSREGLGRCRESSFPGALVSPCPDIFSRFLAIIRVLSEPLILHYCFLRRGRRAWHCARSPDETASAWQKCAADSFGVASGPVDVVCKALCFMEKWFGLPVTGVWTVGRCKKAVCILLKKTLQAEGCADTVGGSRGQSAPRRLHQIAPCVYGPRLKTLWLIPSPWFYTFRAKTILILSV